MERKPVGLPVVGDVAHNNRFGGGCSARVINVLPPSKHGRSWRVSVHLTTDDGHEIENRGRCWSLATWLDFSAPIQQESQP